MTPPPRFGFIVEYVDDIDAARRFYVDVLGLAVEREHPRFVQFDTLAIAADSPMRDGARQELYWLVEDAGAALDSLRDVAEVCMPLTRLPFGTVFGVTGPGGRPRYLLELASDRPSRAAPAAG